MSKARPEGRSRLYWTSAFCTGVLPRRALARIIVTRKLNVEPGWRVLCLVVAVVVEVVIVVNKARSAGPAHHLTHQLTNPPLVFLL